MPIERLNRFKRVSLPLKARIYFEEGLHGFERVQFFFLTAKQEELPFLWLEAQGTLPISFAVIDPFIIFPEYDPEISKSDIFLDAEENYILLSIVNLNERTLNLAAPILVHWPRKIAKQILIKDNPEYPLN